MFWGKRKSGDCSAEIEAHIALETDRLREQGYSEADARLTELTTGAAPTAQAVDFPKWRTR